VGATVDGPVVVVFTTPLPPPEPSVIITELSDDEEEEETAPLAIAPAAPSTALVVAAAAAPPAAPQLLRLAAALRLVAALRIDLRYPPADCTPPARFTLEEAPVLAAAAAPLPQAAPLLLLEAAPASAADEPNNDNDAATHLDEVARLRFELERLAAVEANLRAELTLALWRHEVEAAELSAMHRRAQDDALQLTEAIIEEGAEVARLHAERKQGKRTLRRALGIMLMTTAFIVATSWAPAAAVTCVSA
jgi:hypothetical protein